jgi:hypothetical protein
LFDQGDISSDTDKVPDLGLLDSFTSDSQWFLSPTLLSPWPLW